MDRGSGGERRGGAGRLRRPVLALALLAAAGLGGWQAWRAATRAHLFTIRTIRYQGLSRSTADELLALSPVKVGDDLLAVDVDAVEAALARDPWIRKVEVRREWPPALRVQVTERRPSALIELSGLYLVDEDGEVFKRAAPGDGLDLPVITGVSRADWLQHRDAARPLLVGALALAHAWRADGWDAAMPLSEIHLDPGEGTTIYVGEEGTEVRLGSGDLAQKLSRLEQVLASLRDEGKKAEVLHLDNRLHPSWVAVRLAGAASP